MSMKYNVDVHKTLSCEFRIGINANLSNVVLLNKLEGEEDDICNFTEQSDMSSRNRKRVPGRPCAKGAGNIQGSIFVQYWKKWYCPLSLTSDARNPIFY